MYNLPPFRRLSFSHVSLWESSCASFLGHTVHNQMNDLKGSHKQLMLEVYGGSQASGLQKRKMTGVHKT